MVSGFVVTRQDDGTVAMSCNYLVVNTSQEGSSSIYQARRYLEAGGHRTALFRLDGAVFALLDQCSHGYARSSDGYTEDGWVECPLHQGRVDIRTDEPAPPSRSDTELPRLV